MPKKSNQKLRMIYMKEILERQTDIDHGIARDDFERYLSHRGIEAPTRKTFYDDLDALDEYGMDIGRDPYGKAYKLYFRVFVVVDISIQVYGWVFGLGEMARIVGPEDVRQGYLDMMKDVQESMNKAIFSIYILSKWLDLLALVW